jgi:tetraacyldisaccharide 4'-kinase
MYAMNEAKIRNRWYEGGPVSLLSRLGTRLFSGLVAARKKLYAWKILKTHTLKAPVIVVGNITAGGGGKTPFVIWLAQHLKDRGHKPGIVSRGYGGKRKVEPMFVTPNANPAASGDEPLLVAQKTGLPVMVGKNRVKAAQSLIKQYHCDVIISDDGLQHYSMGRTIEIVMLDARWGTGNGQMIPAGPLREPMERLNEVDLVIHKGQVADGHYYDYQIDDIVQLNHPSVSKPLAHFRSQKILAMAGIANPESFFRLLSSAGFAIVKKPLSDHHQITLSDFPEQTDVPVIITEKDAVKCQDMNLPHVWVVKLGISLPEHTVQALNQLLEEQLS